ncbi:hypothetical protein [Chitinimonas sp.]|uniref:RCC1-like domain-containing protein n=1 Tax=Chitinimonas sp. TaxID=1934313 RepID=UPI0035ADAAD8
MRALLCSLSLLLHTATLAATPQVAGGYLHSLALSSDGNVYAWGDDSSGQLGSGRKIFRSTPVAVEFPQGGSVKAVAAGSYHSLALMKDGSVLGWGNNYNGQLGDGGTNSHGVPVKVAGLPPASSVAAGETFSLAIDNSGRVWGWGRNSDGQLGDGSDSERLSPVQAKGVSGAVAVRAGVGHTLALNGSGEVWAWGANDAGQLGMTASVPVLLPAKVNFPAGTPKLKAIDAGGGHSFALDVNGRVWAWGSNTNYALGDGSNVDRAVPAMIAGLEQVVAIAAGPSSGAAISSDGKAWIWGFWSVQKPVQVPLPAAAKAIQLGDSHYQIQLADGSLVGGGDNSLGQLASGDDISPNDLVVIKPKGLPAGLSSYATGYYHTLAADSSGKLWAWGYDALGQLGDAVETTRNIPIQVAGLTNVSRIAAGALHSLALKNDGTVWAWGDNTDGAVGSGSEAGFYTGAVAVKGLANIRRIAAGGGSSAALDSTGRLWTWGNNDSNQLGIGDDIERDTNVPGLVGGVPPLLDIAIGGTHMLGIDAGGAVWSWGDNGDGQLGDGVDFYSTLPRTTVSFGKAVAVAAGNRHSLALDSSGKVWAWGNNMHGQLAQEEGNFAIEPLQVQGLPGNIIAIAAGGTMSYALAADGSLWGWGSDYVGELGDGLEEVFWFRPTRVLGSNYAAMAGGAEHLLAVRSDGIVWSTGWNYSGQLGEGSFGNQSSYTGVFNLASTGFLDLAPAIANLAIPADKQPPFFAQTQKIGTDLKLTVNTTLKLPQASSSSRLARAAGGLNVYVGAVVPGKYFGLPAGQTALYLKTRTQGWTPYVGGAIGEYLNNVSQSNDQGLLIDIITSTDLSSLVGTQFYIGYGSDADDMLRNGRLRMVYEVQKPR